MAEVASAYVSLLPSTRGFGSKLTSQVGPEVNSAGKRIGSGFGKMFALAGAGIAAAGIGAFFKGAIEQASGLEEAGTKIQAIFGGGSNAVQKFADQGAQALGQTKLEVLNAAANFGTFGKAAGLSGGKLAEFSTGFTSLATDLASFNNTTPQEAVEAIGSALRGEAEPMRRFGVLLDDATLRNEALKLGLVSTTKDALTPQQKVLAAQSAIYKQTSDAQGDFARTSGGLANQQRILSAQWTDMKARVGEALLPAVTQLVTYLNGSVVPAISTLASFLTTNVGPAFTMIRDAVSGVFSGGAGGGFLASLTSIGAALQANFLPVLQTMATTFTTSILPAVTALATYLAANLFPVFAQIAGVISGQVIPILASLAQFFYGTVYPAIIAVARSVASGLRPVFEQLVATFRGSVLPTIQMILVKFREWQPTIQKVIGVLLSLSGQAIAFAAVILGKVLPPVIRFAGFIISNVVPAILAWIGMVGNIIGKLVSFGKAVVERVQDFARFAAGVREKVGEVLAVIAALPGKVMGYLSGLASQMYRAGAEMMSMLASGIRDKIGDALGALKSAASQLAALVPGSPVKEGPLRSLNNGHAGKEIMGMLAKGIKDGTAGPVEAMKDAAGKMLAALQEKRDGIKTVVDSIKSDMASLASSIATAFAGNPFEALTGSDMFAQGVATMSNLSSLRKAFKKLRGWGIDPQFLSSLFSSGNSALILDLASGPKWQAQNNAGLFSANQQLADRLGGQVARNQYGEKLDRANRRLEEIEKAIKRVGRDVGRELDKVGGNAARRR